MNNSNFSKGNLNDIPYEIEQPLDGKYFIDEHSLLHNIFVFFYVLIFFGFSIFIIYKFIYGNMLSNNFVTDKYINITKEPLFMNITNIHFKNAHLKLGAKLYPTLEYHNFDALFNISVSPEKRFFSTIKFSNISNQLINAKDRSDILATTIFEQDISSIEFISIQGYFANLIQNSTEALLTIDIIHNPEYSFILYSNLYFIFSIIVFLIIKTYQLKKIEELTLSQFIPLLYLSFCAVSLIPSSFIHPNKLLLIQKMYEAYLTTLFFEISYSYTFFSVYSLPFSFFESFYDFFLSSLILFYSFIFQILNIPTKESNLTIFLSILFALYVIRNLQKGFFWYQIRTKESYIRSIIYTFVNIVITTLLISCDFLISREENAMYIVSKFIFLVSFGIIMSIYNLP